MNKILKTLLIITLLTSILSACGNGKIDEETAEKYIAISKDVITLLNNKQYEELIQLFNRDYRVAVTVEGLKNLEPLIEQSGDFIKIDQTSVEREKDYDVAILATKYSNEHRIFTIKFDYNDEISELLVQ